MLSKSYTNSYFITLGDPFVFGRGGEEVLEFRKFGVEPAVIPVSSSDNNA